MAPHDTATNPAGAVIFDHHDPAFVEGQRTVYANPRGIYPVIHTPAHGGFWVLTDHAGVSAAARGDTQTDLRADPDLIPDAIEEFLRFEAPIQGFARKAVCPVDLGGQAIAEGDLIWLAWGAANHDPAVFPAPETLDIRRTLNRHMTFGIGAHLCSGARLARAELAIMLRVLLDMTRSISLTGLGIVQPRTNGHLLGKEAVHVSLD